MALVHFGDVFRCSRGHNGAAIFATFWTHINEVVAHLQHVEVVFNDHHSVALIHQFVEDVDEQLDVLKVKTSGGLVEDVEGAARSNACQFRGQLDPLSFAAAERGALLAQRDVPEPHCLQR